MNRLTSGKLFFPVNSFRTPDKLSDSVNDAESHDVKKLDSLSGFRNLDKNFLLRR